MKSQTPRSSRTDTLFPYTTLFPSTAQGVYVRAPDGRWSQPEWTPMFGRPNALLQIARDDDGAYWLGSQRGLWRVQPGQRSEGHTSALQSLIRNSYAVICLKTKDHYQQR